MNEEAPGFTHMHVLDKLGNQCLVTRAALMAIVRQIAQNHPLREVEEELHVR